MSTGSGKRELIRTQPIEVDIQPQPAANVIASGPRKEIPDEAKALASYRVIGIIAIADAILIVTAPLFFWLAFATLMLVVISLPVLLVLLLIASYFAIRVKIIAKKLRQEVSGLHTLILVITPVALIIASVVIYLMQPDSVKFL